ncbi:MAG: hypothetical protein WA642_03890 [Steroidobacteraceae bacterium]
MLYALFARDENSPWKQTNWDCPGSRNIGVSVVGNSTSTWQIDCTVGAWDQSRQIVVCDTP